MKVKLEVPFGDPLEIDWPRDLPLPRIGEHIALHGLAPTTLKVVDLVWDASDPNLYPALTVTVK